MYDASRKILREIANKEVESGDALLGKFLRRLCRNEPLVLAIIEGGCLISIKGLPGQSLIADFDAQEDDDMLNQATDIMFHTDGSNPGVSELLHQAVNVWIECEE